MSREKLKGYDGFNMLENKTDLIFQDGKAFFNGYELIIGDVLQRQNNLGDQMKVIKIDSEEKAIYLERTKDLMNPETNYTGWGRYDKIKAREHGFSKWILTSKSLNSV